MQCLANNKVYRCQLCFNCVFCNLIGQQNFCNGYETQYRFMAMQTLLLHTQVWHSQLINECCMYNFSGHPMSRQFLRQLVDYTILLLLSTRQIRNPHSPVSGISAHDCSNCMHGPSTQLSAIKVKGGGVSLHILSAQHYNLAVLINNNE